MTVDMPKTRNEADQAAVTALRSKLKHWEHAFAATNGHKPRRDDIAKDATARSMYREYARLSSTSMREISVMQTTPRKKDRNPGSGVAGNALRERPGNLVSSTPRKQSSRTLATSESDSEPTPAFIRCALGPTPQKDGHIVGLFDTVALGTPARGYDAASAYHVTALGATPSKAAAPPNSCDAVSRTPQSSSKRFYLEAFAATPLKRKRDEELHTPATSRRQFATPSFLRRSFPLAAISEEPADPPFRKRGLVRSLSSIIQGLKRQEAEQMDDEWDILEELEAEERGESRPRLAPTVLVEDSQTADMPLGPDKALPGSDDDAQSETAKADGGENARKPWKKKGLKRQTKRVKMRPVVHNPQKAAEAAAEGAELDIVEETQIVAPQSMQKECAVAEALDSADLNPEANATNDKPAQKAKKSVNALAHANYRKLKIKNKNSKANGRGRRFGRR